MEGYENTMRALFFRTQMDVRVMSSRKDLRTIALGVGLAVLLLGAPKALARPRLGVVQGRILVPRSRKGCRISQRAYWEFTVPNVTPPSCRPMVRGYLVTLDAWDPKAAKRMFRKATKGGSSPRMRIYGVDFRPSLLLVPKEEQSYQVVFSNQDRFIHEIHSPDKPGDDGQVVAPDGSVTLSFDRLKPLDRGDVQVFRVRCKRFPHMRGAVVFVRSTALARPTRSGAFRIRVPQGPHVLRVWHDGKKVAERKVTVGRRPIEVTIDLRPRKPVRAARPRARGGRAAGNGARSARPAGGRRHGRRRHRRRRRR